MKAKNIIKVYGTDSNVQQLVVSVIENYLQLAQLDYDIQKITDVSVFIDLKLKSIPSIQLNNGEIYPVKNGNFFKQNLRRALSKILVKDNFGQLKKILVPIDFSESATNAFMYAHRLATEINAVTRVIHVDDTPNGQSAIKSKFTDFINQVDTDWGGDFLKASLVDNLYMKGHVSQTLLNVINETNPEIVVTGINGIAQKNIGSVTKSLLHNSNSNVLLVPQNAKYTKEKSIYLPYTNCNHLTEIRDNLSAFCKNTNTVLNLIKVSDEQSRFDCDVNSILNLSPNYIKHQNTTSENLHNIINEMSALKKTDILGVTNDNYKNLSLLSENNLGSIINAKSKIPILVVK